MGRIDDLNKKKYVQRIVRFKFSKWYAIQATMQFHNRISLNGIINRALDKYIEVGFHFDDYLGDLEQYKLERFGFKESDLDLEKIREYNRTDYPYIIKEYKDRKHNIGLVRVINSNNNQIMYDLYLPWRGKTIDDSNTIPNLAYNLDLNISSMVKYAENYKKRNKSSD